MSYAHADFAYVRRLVMWLTQRGVEVWFDEEIPTGERWETLLGGRVESAAALVVVMSPNAAVSEWVAREVRLAQSLGIPVLPILLAGGVILGLDDLQYEPVLDGRLPSDAFVARLPRRVVPVDRVARARVRHLIGLVPGEADCFQDRDLLAELDAALSGGGTAVLTQVLTGLGGVGKTQLAAALARRLIDAASLDVLVWVTAQSRDAVVSAYAHAAHELLGVDPGSPEQAARSLLEWLATTTGQWLIVLDDVADPGHLSGLWPPRSVSGRVAVTTRRRDAALASHGRVVAVGVFTSAQAHAYLVEKFADRPDRLVEAEQLAADVGYLPLMLGQAAAFIADQDITCAEYRRRFAQTKTLVDVVPEPGGMPDDYRLPVAATLLLSVDVADRLRPAGLARPLLAMLSLLDPNGIPIGVITAPATATYLTDHRAGGVVGADPVTPEWARDALMCLARLNLVDLVTDQDSAAQLVRVHDLVQRATREQSRAEQIDAAALAAAEALRVVWPEVERDTGLAQQLRSNTDALRAHAEDRLWVPDAHGLLFRMGQSLGEAGLLNAAIAHFERMSAEASIRIGPHHPCTLDIRRSLARWRGQAGDYAGAAAEFERLLPLHERILGPDHPKTLQNRYYIARWLGHAGDAARAETLSRELLADRLRVLGADHPDTLQSRHDTARWMGAAGNPAGALAAFERLLPDRISVLGPDHKDTLITRSNIANWLRAAGNPRAAVVACTEVLADRIGLLGPNHIDTLTSRLDLARCIGEAGDPLAAARALQELLPDRERISGPDHPDTLATRSELARWLGEAGDQAGALAAFEALLRDRLRVLGPDHADTLTTRGNLADHRGAAGDSAGAAVALEAVLADQLRVLGPDHPHTMNTRNNLARWRERAAAPSTTTAGSRAVDKKGVGRPWWWSMWRTNRSTGKGFRGDD